LPGGPGQPQQRKRRKWPWITGGILAGVVVLFVVAGVLASTSTGTKQASSPAAPSAQPAPASPVVSSPIPSSASNLAQVGDTMTITQDGQDAADITITRVSVSTQPADPEFGEAPQNGYYVTAHVKVVVRQDFTGGFDVSSQDFYAKRGSTHYDEEGNANAFEAPGNGQDLNFATLGAGETTTGTLVFDLPSPHGRIAYAPNLDGQALGYWKY
jgi:hypothetical protein